MLLPKLMFSLTFWGGRLLSLHPLIVTRSLTDAVLETLDQKQLEQQHGNLIDNQPQQDNNNHIELQPDKDHFPEVLPDLLITDRPHIDESLDQDEIAPQIDELQVGCGDHVQERLEKVLQADEVHFAVRKCSAHQVISFSLGFVKILICK